MTRLQYFFATGFYSGYSPIAPGTIGSLLLVFLVYLFSITGLMLKLSIFLILLFLGVWAANKVSAELGKDPQIVVIDEMAGQMLPLFLCTRQFGCLVFALILFRLFDIVKPFPVKSFENIPGGWGIMLDDVAAGLYALGVLWLLKIWFPI